MTKQPHPHKLMANVITLVIWILCKTQASVLYVFNCSLSELGMELDQKWSDSFSVFRVKCAFLPFSIR